MARGKVQLTFIENKNERKASYNKRQVGYFKKAEELSKLCDVEVAVVIYSEFHDEPKVFPNDDTAIRIFTKFRELPNLEQSKHMMRREDFIRQRIQKLEVKLQKLRKENRVKEITIMMHEVLKEKYIPEDIHLDDLNDLVFVMKQDQKKVHEMQKKKIEKEGSTLNSSRSIVEPMVPGEANSAGPTTSPLASVGGLLSVVPLMNSSIIHSGTNFEEPMISPSVPDVDLICMLPTIDPPTVPLFDPTVVPQPRFHLEDPSWASPQTNPLMEPIWAPYYSSSSSQMFPPMVPQIYPSIPQQMTFPTTPLMTPPIPSASTSSPMMATPMYAPMIPPLISQIDPLMNVPPMSASMNNYQNCSVDLKQSPTLSEQIDWNDDNVMALFDDSILAKSKSQ